LVGYTLSNNMNISLAVLQGRYPASCWCCRGCLQETAGTSLG
jgi:hypothetical protein